MSVEVERPASRVGKKAITVWVDPIVKRRFDQLCLDNDLSAQSMVETALDLLFDHYKSGQDGQSDAWGRQFWDGIRIAIERKYAKKKDAAL